MLALLIAAACWLQDPTEDEIKKWVVDLGSDYKEERDQAKEKLVKAGKKAETALEEGLKSDDSRVKLACVDVLRQIGNTTQVDKIGEMFENATDEDTQVTSFDYLKQAGQAAEKYLIRALKRSGTYFKSGALDKLTEIKSKAAADAAFELYGAEEDSKVREKAFRLIKELGKDAQKYLVKFVNDPEPKIRREAVEGLKGVFDPTSLETIGKLLKTELDDGVIMMIVAYLADAPNEHVEGYLIEALDSQSNKTKSQVVKLLAQNRCEKALDKVLTTAQNTQDHDVKMDCIAYASTFPDKTEAFLIKLLDDSNVAIRRKVITDLTSKRSKAGFDKIRELYRKDAEKDVRIDAFKYFLALGTEATDDILKGLNDDQSEIKELAIEGVGELRLEVAIEPLIEVCRRDKTKTVLDKCVSALAKIGKKAIAASAEAATAEPGLKSVADGVANQFDDVVVETVLAKYITPKETTGTFEGQFDELSKLEIGPDRTAEVLIRMHGENYEPRTKKLIELRRVLLLNRLATLALGHVGGDKAKAFLAARFDALMKNNEYDGLVEEVGVALYRYGDKSAIDRLVERIQKEAEAKGKDDKFTSCERFFAIGAIRNRVGDVKGALEAYVKLEQSMAADQDKDTFLYSKVLYNMACAQARLGDKKSSVDLLRKAVEAGFKDKEWIEIDKDLEPIRGEDGYKTLIADEKLFRED